MRIARLAEEKRHLYVKEIVEKMNQVFINVKSLVVAGPAEMKNHVCECDLMDYRIKPLILNKITLNTITEESIYGIMNMNLFKTNQISEDEILCKEIITAIKLDNNRYIYGKEQIEYYLACNNCEFLYVHKDINYHYDNKIIINSNDIYGKLFYDYGGIVLKCYYNIDINNII